MEPVLRELAEEHGLYLDKQGYRPVRRGKKVTWVDDRGNSHDLDFVLERGGTDEKLGTPAAFIEIAWRRYTKHSKAKAQEIQGAVEPMLARFAEVRPFAGAVVAGVWTGNALTQLESSGFTLLKIEYAEIIAAFRSAGIDVDYDESTSDGHLQLQVDRFDQLTDAERDALSATLRTLAPDEYERFIADLNSAIVRTITRITVLPLHGTELQFGTVSDATTAIASYDKTSGNGDFQRIEVAIRFSNGDSIEASFRDRTDAVAFLWTFD